MKKYTLPIILLAVSFSISLSGCQKQEGKSTEQNRIEAGNTQTVQPETGAPEESQAPEEAEKDLAEPIEVGISEGNLEGRSCTLNVRLYMGIRNGSFRLLCRRIC